MASLVADEIHAHQGASRTPTRVVAAKNHSSTPTDCWIFTWISWDFHNESGFFREKRLQFLSGSAVDATSQAGSGRRFLQDAGQEGDLGQRTLAGWLHHC